MEKHFENKFKNTNFWINGGNDQVGQMSIPIWYDALGLSIPITAKMYCANGEHSLRAFKVSTRRLTGKDTYSVFLCYVNCHGSNCAKKWDGTIEEYEAYSTQNERAFNISNEIGLKY